MGKEIIGMNYYNMTNWDEFGMAVVVLVLVIWLFTTDDLFKGW